MLHTTYDLKTKHSVQKTTDLLPGHNLSFGKTACGRMCCIQRGEDCLLDFSDGQVGETVLLLSQPIEAVILTESRVNDPNQDMKQLGRAYLGLLHLLE